MKKKFRKSILVTILTISLLSSSLPVLACEQVSESDNNIVQITDPDEIKAAAEMFGLDEEEAEGVTFYSQNIEVLNPGITQMPTFTMWSFNRGADRIFNGHQVGTTVLAMGNSGANLHVRFRSYQDVIWNTDIIIGNNGKGLYEGGFYNIWYGGTYYMDYEVSGNTSSIAVSVVYEVR